MLGRLWSVSFFVAHFANARTTGFPAACSSDWSLDAEEHVVRCPNVESESPVKCAPSSCSNFPICSSCVNVATQERRNSMTCRKGYNMIDPGSSAFAMCIDQDESAFECNGGCEGTLTCDSCAFDVTPFKMQHLQKRANPMVNGMLAGQPSRGGFGPGGLEW